MTATNKTLRLALMALVLVGGVALAAPGDPSVMVAVPAGSYDMGCTGDARACYPGNATPVHAVTTAAFQIDLTEVTVEQYQQCVEAAVCTSPAGPTTPQSNYGVAGRESHPVNGVQWAQAQAYCTWAGKRLCSEAEWEKAARGTDGRRYPWVGDKATCEHAVLMHTVRPGCGKLATQAVSSKPTGVSPYGAHDLVGNVAEWVADCWHASYDGAPADGSVWTGEAPECHRVTRGGSYRSASSAVATWNRVTVRHAYASPTIGFRCCKAAE